MRRKSLAQEARWNTSWVSRFFFHQPISFARLVGTQFAVAAHCICTPNLPFALIPCFSIVRASSFRSSALHGCMVQSFLSLSPLPGLLAPCMAGIWVCARLGGFFSLRARFTRLFFGLCLLCITSCPPLRAHTRRGFRAFVECEFDFPLPCSLMPCLLFGRAVRTLHARTGRFLGFG